MATDNKENNNNTIHANYFIKGMNSDISPELIDSQLYQYGLNVRINSYTSVQEALNPNNTAGAITPVLSGVVYEGINIYGVLILCTNSINDIGIVITADDPDKDGKKYWRIYRTTIENGIPVFTEICSGIKDKYTTKNKFTTVIVYDSELSIKLFIADGEHPIIAMNIHEDNLDYLNSLTSVDQIIDRYLYPCEQARICEKISGTLPVSVIQYSYRFFKKYGTCSKVSPLTKRFYTMNYTKDTEAGNKNGTSTNIGYKLAIPLEQDGVDFTKVFDHCQLFRIQQGGKTENTESDTKDDSSDKTDSKKNQEGTSGNDKESREGAETPIKAFLIQEFQLPKNDKTLYVEDSGLSPLQEFTLDEYASFVGETIVPQSITYLLKNLFAANIKDYTVIEDDDLFYKSHTFSVDHNDNITLYDPVTKTKKAGPYENFKGNKELLTQYYLTQDYDINYGSHDHIMLHEDGLGKRIAGGKSDWVTWRMVTALTPLYSTSDDSKKLKPIYTGKWDKFLLYVTVRTDGNLFDVFIGKKCATTLSVLEPSMTSEDPLNHTNWQDPLYASHFRSLRRDETYRYGIIYYTKYGQRTDVQWIADIKTPNLEEVPLSHIEYGLNFTVSLGLEFTVNCDDPRFRYYLIVRCPKARQWSKNMYLVICARPMKHTTPSVLSSTTTDTSGNTSVGTQEAGAGRYSPWLPNPYAIDLFMQYINTYWAKNHDYYDIWSGFYGSNLKCQKNTYLTSPGENYIVQMFSEDINVNEDVVYDALAGSNCWLKRAYTYDGLNYLNFNRSLNNYKTSPAGIDRFILCNHKDLDVIYNYMDVKNRSRNNAFYAVYATLMVLRYFPSELASKYDTRLNIGLGPGMKEVLDNGTGLALTPTRYWDTVFYDPLVTHLSQGANCNSEKPSFSITHYYDRISDNSVYRADTPKILSIAKAKEPQWDDGFGNITMEGADVKSGSKTYKSFTSFVGGNTFCNWIASGMYDLRLSQKQSQYGVGVDYRHTNAGYSIAMGGQQTQYGDGSYAGVFTALSGSLYNNLVTRSLGACGWIGPGTRCLIAALSGMYRIERFPGDGKTWGCNADFGLSEEDSFEIYRDKIYMQFSDDKEKGYGQYSSLPAVTCSLTNIQHQASNFSGITRDQLQYDTYYSHGNFGKCNGNPIYVFDGDIFPTPVEITPIHKTYDFQSIGDTIPSALVNLFVLAESVFNSFFDYGYNFRNTQSDNILLDVAQITGICSQDRPLYKQNMVFAENNVTLESFTAASLEKSNDTFPTRIVYGVDDDVQTVDNRTLFLANNYVDVGAEHGPVTNIDAKNNTLYFWQQHAFGKLAVNERSLVTDTNNNTIQLGQGGVLSRYDYLNELYGMSIDTCNNIFIDSSVLWYDTSAKTVMMYSSEGLKDVGGTLGVQNVINTHSSDDSRHVVFYDMLNKEINIDEFQVDGSQALLIFNTNNIFTSFYNREFDECLTLNGICYLINLKRNSATQINYIPNDDNFLKPSVIQFVINNMPQYIKVFDTQQISTISRMYDESFVEDFMKNKTFTFCTNMQDETVVGYKTLNITDRESNIRYVLPRYGGAEYGNRLRGKWLNVRMEDSNPRKDYTISNIITNTRVSFS